MGAIRRLLKGVETGTMATLGLSEAERESIERFERDVIQPSMTGLVVLDFWATTCAPCRYSIFRNRPYVCGSIVISVFTELAIKHCSCAA